MKILLTHPVEHGDTTYQAVELRRAKAKDMVRIADHIPALASLGDAGAEGAAGQINGAFVLALIAIVSTLSGIPEEAVEEFDFSDLVEVGTKAAGFLSSGASPGEPSSPTSPIS